MKMASLPAWRILAALLLAAALSGCSAVSVLNALVPTDGLEIRGAIAYGDNPRQRLDVYRPRDASGARPVIVFFYGGSWDSGSRESYLFVAEALVSRGFVVVVPDYRVYPEVVFPGFLEDAASAVAWTKRNAARFGGDPAKVFVMGHSAGAHIAAMIALDPQFLAREGLTPAALSGFIGLAGPYDFLPLKNETLKRIFAPPETIARTQPINFVTAAAPPALLASPETDSSVSPGNSQRLAARLREKGVSVTELRYPKLNHYTIVGSLAAPLRGGEPLLDEIERFVRGR
jgi:acetyl esterase/lipase